MFGALGSAAIAAATAPLSLQDDAEAPLVFAASSAPAPDVPQWDLAPFHPDADPLASADDERSPTFASFDPVSFEQDDAGQGAAAQWTLSEAVPRDGRNRRRCVCRAGVRSGGRRARRCGGARRRGVPLRRRRVGQRR
ncbi:hypothetical protein G6F57_019406 [Rhizopus arrhizus]|nr:hypothetical protein G6F57_019406 [Rhizopus arrhizus]